MGKNSLMSNLCKISGFDWNTDFEPCPGTRLAGVSVVAVGRGGSLFILEFLVKILSEKKLLLLF